MNNRIIKISKKLISLLLVVITVVGTFAIISNAADASTLITKSMAQEKVNRLCNILDGKYFTTTGSAVYSSKNDQCYNVNVIKSGWLKSATGFVPNTYTLMPRHFYSSNGLITCNAWSCAGFANYALWYVYATKSDDNVIPTNVYTGYYDKSNLDAANLWPGDVIRIGESHSVVYLSHDGSGMRVLDCNWNHDNRIAVRTIPYSWKTNAIMACTRGKNYSTVRYYTLDLNSYVGNSYKGDISGIATADIYINGTKVANDCTDFYQSVKAGSTYTIKDIKTKSGYTYNGASSVSGKINGNVNVNLPFSKTYYMLDLNSYLDGSYRGNISGIATADVYINGSKVANDCTDFYQSVKAGSTYTIKDIKTKSGYKYNGSTSVSGKMNGDVNVNLSFSTIVPYSTTNFKMKSGVYTNAYTSSSLQTKTGRIYPGDVITINRIYSNGVVRLSCPWDNGSSKTVYAKASELKFKATKYIDAFSSVNGSKVGRVYPNDLVTVIAIYSSGWMKCSCPWNGNGNKTIYIKTSAIY